jgi:glycerophosphoryl diester phosphodiesterase
MSRASRTVLAAAVAVCSGGSEAMELLESQRVEESFDELERGSLPAGWTVASGVWAVEGGELIGGAAAAGAGEPARIEVAGGSWESFRLEVEARFLESPEKSSALAVDFGGRREGGAERHRLRLRPEPDRDGIELEYGVRRGGAWEVRARGAASRKAPAGAPRRLVLESCGGRVHVALDGAPALDSALGRDVERGPIALVAISARAAFDDLRISSLTAAEATALRIDYGPLRDVVVIAHRGSSRKAPENTLASLRLGVEEGASGVEFDVHRTLDGELVLLHDDDLARTTDSRAVLPAGADFSVAKRTLAEIRKLDAGSWKSPEYSGERVPTLREALELLRGRATAVVEIKPDDIGRDVARAIRAAGVETEVFVQSFSARAIREFREELPLVATGFLTGERISADARERARGHLCAAREAGANAIVCDFRLAGPEYLAELHRHAVSVWVYTVNDPAVMDALVRLGVDGIITDVPAELIALLKKKDGP